MQELVKNIENWAEERGLIDVKLAPKQYLKALEEIGETARAILKNDKEQIVDGIGDIAVCVIVLAKQLGDKVDYTLLDAIDIFGNVFDVDKHNDADIFGNLFGKVNSYNVSRNAFGFISAIAKKQGFTLEFCLQSAWNEIKDRKGKLVNGTFIKES